MEYIKLEQEEHNGYIMFVYSIQKLTEKFFYEFSEAGDICNKEKKMKYLLKDE